MKPPNNNPGNGRSRAHAAVSRNPDAVIEGLPLDRDTPPAWSADPTDAAATGLTLTPAQQAVVDEVMQRSRPGSVTIIQSNPGQGRTTVLVELQRRMGGRIVSVREFVLSQLDNDPFKFEEAVYRLLDEALQANDIVFVDDFDMVLETTNCFESARCYFVNMVLRTVADSVIKSHQRLLIVDCDQLPASLQAWSHVVKVRDLQREDREFLFQRLLPADSFSSIDFDEVFRLAQHLDCRQIALACEAIRDAGAITTATVLEYLQRHRRESNVDLSQVQKVTFADLVGMESVIEALRVHLLTPLRESELSREWNLRPKRGVLLHGPPGTGKTSVGRALAHELGARFFLIDGELEENEKFMRRVRCTFSAARENAPAVVFIDDSDVLLQNADAGENHDFYRYLLAHLDGLHTEKDNDICVVMTAMEISTLPKALLRSGRIELWLEVKLPDASGRAALMHRHGTVLWERFGRGCPGVVIEQTDGFSCADMHRLVEDVKNLVAARLMAGQTEIDLDDLLLQSVAAMREAMARYRHGPSGTPTGFRKSRT